MNNDINKDLNKDLIKNSFKSTEDINIEDVKKNYVPHMKERYKKIIIPNLIKKFNIKNIHQVPKIESITISSCINNLKHNVELIYKIYNSLYLMTGVKPIYTTLSKSVSQFKTQKGSIVGCKVVVRKDKMYELLERFLHIYLPNLKEFKGIPEKSINGKSLSIGVNDAHIVPEITNYLTSYFGFTLTINVNIDCDKAIMVELFKQLDIPII